MTWLLWALISAAQTAAFTGQSRSRNSADPRWHRRWSYASHAAWALNLAFGVDMILAYKHAGQWGMMALAIAFYAAVSTEASVRTQEWLLRVETGKRRVGAA